MDDYNHVDKKGYFADKFDRAITHPAFSVVEGIAFNVVGGLGLYFDGSSNKVRVLCATAIGLGTGLTLIGLDGLNKLRKNNNKLEASID